MEEKTLHKAGSSTVTNINLEREEKKKRKEKKRLLQHRYSSLVTQPSRSPAEQVLTLLSRQDMVLSLWYSDSTLDTFFLISKIS